MHTLANDIHACYQSSPRNHSCLLMDCENAMFSNAEIVSGEIPRLLLHGCRTGRLTWHKGFIPANEIWLKIGGDKEGGTFKMTF